MVPDTFRGFWGPTCVVVDEWEIVVFGDYKELVNNTRYPKFGKTQNR